MNQIHACSRQGLTNRQRDCFDFIERYISENRQSPSRRDIASALNLASLGRVNEMLAGLSERGWITVMPHKARSIAIIPDVRPTGYILPPDLDARLRQHCAGTKEDPAAVLADAVALFFDEPLESNAI
jgi:SOS-response transcriptional repressor LexA